MFLEDRRAPYSPYEAEMPEHVISSEFEIRRFLTELLRRGGTAQELTDSVRAMSLACRKLIEATSERRGRKLYVRTPSDILSGGTTSWIFDQSLGELRGVFGLRVAQLAVRYGIDVPDEPATILPLVPKQDSDPESAL